MITKLDEFGGIPCSKAIEHEWHETGANAFTEPYGFTGKEYEKDLGITYFGARYYNPQTTRWLSPDPLYLIRTAKNAEKDQNVYQYGANNPRGFVDPDGMSPINALELLFNGNLINFGLGGIRYLQMVRVAKVLAKQDNIRTKMTEIVRSLKKKNKQITTKNLRKDS